jgi:hypothetical protein
MYLQPLEGEIKKCSRGSAEIEKAQVEVEKKKAQVEVENKNRLKGECNKNRLKGECRKKSGLTADFRKSMPQSLRGRTLEVFL